MAPQSLLVGWALVALWFLLWEAVSGHFTASSGGSRGFGWLPARGGVYLMEAGLLTLLAGLWFASLGAGGWVPIFILVGLLTEWVSRVRETSADTPWRRRLIQVALGTIRTVAAGGVLAWRLS